MKKLSYTAIFGALSALLIFMSSCGKNALNNLSAEESRIYITNRDSTADFQAFHTFSIVDSVAVIQNNQQSQRELTSDDASLLQLIKTQMENRGYTLVNKDQQPDLGINVTRVSNAYLNVVQYPYSWWDTPGYWNPNYWGYGGYDYYFPPTFGYYQTREDILTIDAIDLKNAQKDQKLVGVWNATLKGQGVLNAGNYPTEVKAVFDQSPYLKSGK
ncbi:MAG TPA: DUF4136 domain-containing protein [Chitinophagaceae bacterium]|nr:DUF4136 domain-containing protein [Chitinophagaceae bacterium]